MKAAIKLAIIACTMAVSSAFILSDITELSLGAKIPMGDAKMNDVVSGQPVALNDVIGKKGLLVIFSCNTCPYVKFFESRIKEAAALARKNDMGVIIINSNEAQREEEDSPAEMKEYAESQKYSFPYVIDKDSEVANAFGATRTPHVFLFDSKSLVYKGAIDDNVKEPSAVKEHYLYDAIEAVASGREVKTASTKSIGCTIKRKE